MYQWPRGFALIELVVIIVIIGILAVFAAGRFTNEESFSARGYYDELVSATRFAQRYAVASGCTVRIQINASDYAVTTQHANCGFGTNVQAPTGGNLAGTAPGGISVTSGTGNYYFNAAGDTVDNLGNPGPGGAVQVQGSGSTLLFTVTAVSGFVATAP